MEETQEEKSNEPSPLKQIRTFQGDVAEALHKQQESLVSIQRAEQIKRGGTGSIGSNDRSTTKKEYFMLILGSLLLFSLGGLGAWFAYTEFLNKTSTPPETRASNQFLPIDTLTNIDITISTREDLVSAIVSAAQNTADKESRHIVVRKAIGATKSPLPTSEFLTILDTRAPGNLVRAFDPLFMLGTLGKSSFLIIKLASFENAYAGMLAWEKSMGQDIGPLFATAPLLKNLPSDATFTDLTDRNKDIRVLSFGDTPILMYTFYDSDKLIITDSIETLRTLIERLTREKLSH